MTIARIIGSIYKSFKFWYVFWVSEINDVHGNIVTLQTLTQIFTLFKGLRDWVTDKRNNSLPLLFVLTMLQTQLANLNCGKKVSISVDLDLANSVYNCADIICLSKFHFNSKYVFG